MNFEDRIKYFLIERYEQSFAKPFKRENAHYHVLEKTEDNFFKYDSNLLHRNQFHRWAGSVKSSQAMAYNLLRNFKNVKFEYPLPALEEKAPAMLDAFVPDGHRVNHLYEVKMTEFLANNKISFSERYFDKGAYKDAENAFAEKYISFIKKVQKNFETTPIYGTGIKQLCCHLLGITKKVIGSDPSNNDTYMLYSLCFDGWEDEVFINKLSAYKNALTRFKTHADEFIQEIGLSHRVRYVGFVGTHAFIKENKDNIAKECVTRYSL